MPPVNFRLGFSRLLNSLFRRPSPAAAPRSSDAALQIPCRADLWCRKRTSISTMLDPELFDQYKTGDDRIDEDWIVQSNPPCAFKAELKDGCDALFDLLREDPGLHATKGRLNFTPSAALPLDGQTQAAYLEKMVRVVRTAERELTDA